MAYNAIMHAQAIMVRSLKKPEESQVGHFGSREQISSLVIKAKKKLQLN